MIEHWSLTESQFLSLEGAQASVERAAHQFEQAKKETQRRIAVIVKEHCATRKIPMETVKARIVELEGRSVLEATLPEPAEPNGPKNRRRTP